MKLGRLELPDHAKLIRPGVATWRNPSNNFAIFALHYTADPDKADPSWREQAAKGYPERDWLQEFEMDFSSWSGRPVYASFKRDVHVAQEPIEWNPHYPMWRGWDVGIHACVWGQLVKGQLRVFGGVQIVGAFGGAETKYEEFELPCSGLAVFIQQVKEMSALMFADSAYQPAWKDVIDPSAFNNTITRQEKPVHIFRAAGINPLPGATQDPATRISLVESWLAAMATGLPGEPALLIDPSASIIIDGFAGGYCFEKHGQGTKPEKNGFSHCMDSLQYLISRLPVRPGVKAGGQETLLEYGNPRAHNKRSRYVDDTNSDWTAY